MIPFTSTGKPFLDSLLQRICEEIQDFQTKCRLEHPDRYVTLVMLQDRLEEEWHRYIDDDVKTIVSTEMLEKAFLEIQQWLPTFAHAPYSGKGKDGRAVAELGYRRGSFSSILLAASGKKNAWPVR